MNGTRKASKRVRLAAALLAGGMLTTGTFAGAALAQSTSSSPARGKTTFTWAYTLEPSSLNPLVGYLGLDYTFWATNYDLLLNFGAKDLGSAEPALATSVDASPDGMSFTYHLRQGVKWSDGQPFSADDVAWTLNFYKKYQIPNYALDVNLMDRAVATDPNTVVIYTTKPTSFYAGKSTFMYDYILPEHIWGKWENDPKAAKQFSNVPSVGTGPYIIKEYKPGQFVRLERNPYYWGDSAGLTPHYDEIIYRIYQNEDALAAGLQAGDIDFAQFTSANILNTLKTKPNIVTRAAIIPSFDEIGFNNGSAYETSPAGGFKPHGDGAQALTDPVVRQAIRMAIDSETIVKRVLLGYGEPAWTPVQPGATTGTWNPPPDQALPFDIAGANAKLDQAGYKDTDGDGVRNDPKTGKNLEFRYYIRNSDENTIATAPFVKSWLSEIGIKIDVIAVSSNKLGTIIEDGTYDMFHWGWYPNPDPNYILGVFTCAERSPLPGVYGNNDSYYCNPQYDRLFSEQQTVLDSAKRADIVHQMQAILYRDQPYIMLYYSASLEAYRSDLVTGFTEQPANGGDLLAAYGPYSFISMRPTSAGAAPVKARGIPPAVWVGIAAGVIVVVVAVSLLRRRRAAEDRA